MTNLGGGDKLSTVGREAAQPRVDTPPSPNQRSAKATRGASTGSTSEPDLSPTGQTLAHDAPPRVPNPLGSAAAISNAVDFVQRSIAAKPEVALASFNRMTAERAEALLNTATD